MLANIPVARKDAILMFLISMLLICQLTFGFQKEFAITIAVLSLLRAIYKWMTSPSIETQVSQPIFRLSPRETEVASPFVKKWKQAVVAKRLAAKSS